MIVNPLLAFIIPALLWSQSTLAHMAMVDPPPRRSPRNPHPVGGVDWDMTSPLKGSAQFPCKRAPAGPNVQTYKAGTSITAALGGSARHNGGHCQFSLSYDQGKSFVVLRSIMGDCLKTESNYTVSLPKDLPGGDVIFAWSWVNAIGNREYYMNCADIHINGTGSQVVGPAMLVANLDGYPTIGEFTLGDDGHDLYAKQPLITVRPGPTEAPVNTSSLEPRPSASVPVSRVESPRASGTTVAPSLPTPPPNEGLSPKGQKKDVPRKSTPELPSRPLNETNPLTPSPSRPATTETKSDQQLSWFDPRRIIEVIKGWGLSW